MERMRYDMIKARESAENQPLSHGCQNVNCGNSFGKPSSEMYKENVHTLGPLIPLLALILRKESRRCIMFSVQKLAVPC